VSWKGSRPRCIALTNGSREQVAARLTELASPHGQIDPDRHVWAPGGFAEPREASLGWHLHFLTEAQRKELVRWWLAAAAGAKLPTWDILSSATVNGREGLLLVEAKAHASELDVRGKTPADLDSAGSLANHAQIERCIDEACVALRQVSAPAWKLSRDSHYQLANRFAWAWKIASMGIPVVLVYLGFVGADEFSDPIEDEDTWTRLVHEHASRALDAAVWTSTIDVNGTALVPLLRAARVALPDPPSR
jgi:hypothetical protein